ncbi:MAG: hypothetical protein NWE98_08825 [Candidatus Bathyarchaeota archaeon]|nr:hypothetical protein [Candidatus Bathyarchaeota archaeon]
MSVEQNATLDEIIRDVLVSLVSAQTQANQAFVDSIKELANTEVVISYKKKVDGKDVDQTIKGNALAFGIVPSMFVIKSGIIELKTAITVSGNVAAKSSAIGDVRNKAAYLFKTQAIDARYQNTYAYKTEASSVIKITVVPVPPSADIASI